MADDHDRERKRFLYAGALPAMEKVLRDEGLHVADLVEHAEAPAGTAKAKLREELLLKVARHRHRKGRRS